MHECLGQGYPWGLLVRVTWVTCYEFSLTIGFDKQYGSHLNKVSLRASIDLPLGLVLDIGLALLACV